MGVRNAKKEELLRLAGKSLDEQFVERIGRGLNCSPFEAQAVLEVVREVYGPHLGQCPARALPGQLTLVAVDAEEPAGKPLAACAKRTVCLTVHRGREDDAVLQREGPMAWRRRRLADVCQEALSQGALLTREDLAYRVFFAGPRTISRDLSWLRTQCPQTPAPLRSTVHDMGPVLTHRVEIVCLALDGCTMTEICRKMRHSPQAVANYVQTFTRCAQLQDQGLHAGQIAFLVERGRGLVERYLALRKEADKDPNRAHHLEHLLALGQAGGKKSGVRRGGRSHGR